MYTMQYKNLDLKAVWNADIPGIAFFHVYKTQRYLGKHAFMKYRYIRFLETHSDKMVCKKGN